MLRQWSGKPIAPSAFRTDSPPLRSVRMASSRRATWPPHCCGEPTRRRCWHEWPPAPATLPMLTSVPWRSSTTVQQLTIVAAAGRHAARLRGRQSSLGHGRRRRARERAWPFICRVRHALAVSILGAIADPTRRRILELLHQSERSVSELVMELGMDQPAVSKHLRVLRDSGAVSVRVAGRLRYYQLRTGPLEDLDRWLTAFRTRWS